MASQKTFIQRLWDLFCSLKLTVFLFIVLALASTIGTVIPQNAPPSEYLKLYTVSIYGAIEYLGLVDLYHSWWFVCLLILLCINVLACSFKNFPRTWRTISLTRVALEEDQTKNLPFLETIRVKIPLEEAREKVMHVLKKHLGHPQETTINGTFHLFVEKGKYSRLGVYITHLSILIVLGGGLIGSFFGLKGFVNIMEGQTVDRIVLSKNSFPYELGFKVRCNDFEVTYYPNGAPKDYRSALGILEDGKEILTKTIEVNHPLQYKGISFYQSSYGTSFDQGATITLLVRKKDSKDPGKQYRVEVGESFALPDEGVKVKVNRFVPDFALGENKTVFSRSDQPNNPAVELLISGEKASLKPIWVFQRFPDFHGSKELAYNFLFQDFKGKEYTGLEVVKDPGVWVVWSGCILMLTGIFVTFFLSHRKVWVQLRQAGNKIEVIMAGTASKNQITFEKEFSKLKDEILKGFQ